MLKLGDANGVGNDYAGGGISRIVAILEEHDFWWMAQCVGEGYKIAVGGDDRKTVLFCIFPDSAVGRAATESSACGMY